MELWTKKNDSCPLCRTLWKENKVGEIDELIDDDDINYNIDDQIEALNKLQKKNIKISIENH